MYWITFQTLIKKWYLLDLQYNESEHLKISNLYMASGSITLWEIDGETVETVADFIFFFASKSLQMVIAAMKLKDAFSLEGKLWST